MTPFDSDEIALPEEQASRLPPRLAVLPLVALGVSRAVANEIARLGIETVGDIARYRDALRAGRGLSEDSIAMVRSRFDALAHGEFDPTLSIAGTMPAELEELLVRAGLVRVERTLALLRDVRGLEGDRLTLEEEAKKLGVTRERARQVRDHAEGRIASLIRWFEPRSLRLAREAVARAGGTAPLNHVAWAVALMMPPIDFDPDAYCGWLLQLAADPGARLTADGSTVLGPDPVVIGIRRHGTGPPVQQSGDEGQDLDG
jgi:hypothetical protein